MESNLRTGNENFQNSFWDRSWGNIVHAKKENFSLNDLEIMNPFSPDSFLKLMPTKFCHSFGDQCVGALIW